MYAIRRFIDPPWTSLPPRRIGSVPPGLGTPDCFILIGSDDAPRLRIDVYPEYHSFAIDARVLADAVLVGFAEEVAIVPFSDAPVRSQSLRQYFSKFYDCADYELALSGSDVTRIDRDATIAWQSDMLTLDGIVIECIEDGIIYGQAEWDPPGGWRPFAIRVQDGSEIEGPNR